jgi:hypothetical protein
MGLFSKGNYFTQSEYPESNSTLTYPCQVAKQRVIAGLKCPPDVGPQTMIAKAIPAIH